jgi:hypothetical protein
MDFREGDWVRVVNGDSCGRRRSSISAKISMARVEESEHTRPLLRRDVVEPKVRREKMEMRA